MSRKPSEVGLGYSQVLLLFRAQEFPPEKEHSNKTRSPSTPPHTWLSDTTNSASISTQFPSLSHSHMGLGEGREQRTPPAPSSVLKENTFQ